jgi:dTDP-glucose 4,6-dehydratase
LVEGIARLLGSNELAPVNIGNPNEMTILSFAEKINALTGNRAGIKFQPRPVDDPNRRCPDISKAKRLLNWEPRVTLDEGLAKTIAYFSDKMKSKPAAAGA